VNGNINVSGGNVNIEGNINVIGSLYATGQIVSGFSDEKLKTVVGLIENPVAIVESLRGVRFTPNDLAKSFGFGSNREEHIGILAQDAIALLPQVLSSIQIKDDVFLTVEYDKLTAVLIEAVKELSARIAKLEAINNDLSTK